MTVLVLHFMTNKRFTSFMRQVDDDKQWSTDEAEKLIRFWQGHEESYRIDNPQYLDRGRKSIILRQVAEQLNTTVVEVQNKMHGLRTYYGQLRRLSIKGSQW